MKCVFCYKQVRKKATVLTLLPLMLLLEASWIKQSEHLPNSNTSHVEIFLPLSFQDHDTD